MSAVLVMTNLPDSEAAIQLAEILVSERAGACVNVLAPCRSIYHWQDKMQNEEEVPLLIKTTNERYLEVERLIRLHHPYELPEIICIPINDGLPAYLDWIHAQTR
jgi:periplasmic divalent cation tolerance protein